MGVTGRGVVMVQDGVGELEELRNDYPTSVRPQDGIQRSLFEELVGAAWNLRRVRRKEVELCSNTEQEDEELEKKLDRLARHKTRIERTFHRSLKELKALQTNAIIEATLPPSVRRKILPLSCP